MDWVSSMRTRLYLWTTNTLHNRRRTLQTPNRCHSRTKRFKYCIHSSHDITHIHHIQDPLELEGNVCCKSIDDVSKCEETGTCLWVAGNEQLFQKGINCRAERWVECTVCEGNDDCTLPAHCTDPKDSTGSHDTCDEFEEHAMSYIHFVHAIMQEYIRTFLCHIDEDAVNITGLYGSNSVPIQWNLVLLGSLFCGLMVYWMCLKCGALNEKSVDGHRTKVGHNYNSCVWMQRVVGQWSSVAIK